MHGENVEAPGIAKRAVTADLVFAHGFLSSGAEQMLQAFIAGAGIDDGTVTLA
jgi:hypothetical protein